MAVQKAYERLQAGAAAGQGPQSWRLLLILKVMFHLSICLSSQKLLTLRYIIVPGRLFSITVPTAHHEGALLALAQCEALMLHLAIDASASKSS